MEFTPYGKPSKSLDINELRELDTFLVGLKQRQGREIRKGEVALRGGVKK